MPRDANLAAMRLEIRNPRHFFSGAIFAAIGLLALAIARDYAFGTTMAMGPGYFPAVLSVVLILLGGINMVRGLRAIERSTMVRPPLWPLAAITAGIAGFGLLIGPAGLLPAVFWLVLFACLGGRGFRPLEALALYAVICLIATLIFVSWLNLPTLHLLGSGP